MRNDELIRAAASTRSFGGSVDIKFSDVMLIKRFQFLLWLVALLCSATPTTAQDPNKEDIVRVRTRVIFLETLVRDKQTGQPVKDLSRQDFQVLDDGKPRTLTYFSSEGEGGRERPLALVLVLDLWGGRSLDYLKKTEVAEQLVAAIKRLAPEDEVGVMLTSAEKDKKDPDYFVGTCEMIELLTRDREKTTAALRTVPDRAAQQQAYFKSLPPKRPDPTAPVQFPTRVDQDGLACAATKSAGSLRARRRMPRSSRSS